jgi:hypothetical protein
MVAKPTGLEEVSVFRRLAPTLSVVAALALAMVPAMARAQTNIDQGKPPSEIFANDCAVCHKTTRGLANGKNSLMLSGFLREHYTASREQAAALAAYVLGAGGSGPAAQAPGQKPGPERAKAAVEEPKNAAHPTRESVKPAAVMATPAADATPNSGQAPDAEAPSQDANPTTSAAAPAESQPSDGPPVPRDNIPD